MTQPTISFQDVLTQLAFLWEKSQEDTTDLRNNLQSTLYSLDEQCKVNDRLQQENKDLRHQLMMTQREVDKLKVKVQEAEDDQKQFTKVSHIINMERENTHFKQQIAILERRVAFYQNQCNDLKSHQQQVQQQSQTNQATQTCIDDNAHFQQTDTTDIVNPPDMEGDVNNGEDEEQDDDGGMSVVEKKIKGIVYYVSEDNDIYEKNEDDSIGILKGKIEVSASGKTKVKWYKL